MRQYADVLSRGLAAVLWSTDFKAATEIANAAMENPDIVSIVVTNESNAVVASNRRALPSDSSQLREIRSISYNDELVGQIALEFSAERIVRDIWIVSRGSGLRCWRRFWFRSSSSGSCSAAGSSAQYALCGERRANSPEVSWVDQPLRWTSHDENRPNWHKRLRTCETTSRA